MIVSLDIATLTQAYATGTLSPEAVLTCIYNRIAVEGERPVWISVVPRAEAMAKLKTAPKGPSVGRPLCGQRQHRRGRPADNLRLPGVRLHPNAKCDRRRTA